MAKRVDMSKSGFVVALIVGATALQANDMLVDNVRKAGDTTKEVVCIAQSLTGGMVQVFDCSASAPSSGPAGGTQGGN